ncbi:WS/DGAT/MGAT family O-acyltransferase [Vallicoccus soli]|uniref:Diacylglycerol O-acyltransferase n=1 Tax=Vallicoccus soli TaxID=2339232 RepID=A0A3A3ZIW8_9ACTN|nr:wax ester/triacylglycerol synthase family O-acyltransferase [Vallicoccus soli]RJK95422.1 wax ester/triacylglycerol synthase family O-acyltransferase [Vallicoccus soli]
MPERLSAVDAAFLYLESPTTAMHVGTVAVFEEPVDGFDHDRLVQLIGERIAYVPRYRQRLKAVPGRIANPVWVDDEGFDISYHVRRSALPRPGTRAQLAEFVARVQSRRLDRSRPLWEAYLVEGLEGGRFAVVTKTHQAMVDGVAAVDIAQVIVDASPHAGASPPDSWRPAPEPSWPELVVGAVADSVRRPGELVDTVRTGFRDLRTTAGRVAGGVLALARTTARSAPSSPLNGPVGEQRRYAMVDTALEDFRAVRSAHGASVNDVVLATVAGALREFLMSRGEPLGRAAVVRALVPVSVRPEEGEEPAPGVGGRVRSVLVDLPVGEPSAVMRLHQTAYQTAAHAESGTAVGARTLTGIAGFAPPTLHSLGARVASTLSQRLFNLVVTNVPGPQDTLYADGARMTAAYPVTPLSRGQALSISTTSYAGGVYFGLQADRDLLPDLDVLADLVPEALAQLVAAVR